MDTSLHKYAICKPWDWCVQLINIARGSNWRVLVSIAFCLLYVYAVPLFMLNTFTVNVKRAGTSKFVIFLGYPDICSLKGTDIFCKKEQEYGVSLSVKICNLIGFFGGEKFYFKKLNSNAQIFAVDICCQIMILHTRPNRWVLLWQNELL